MDRDEIETTLKAAFLQCEALFCPLNQQQKEILLEVFFERNSLADGNPLDELTAILISKSNNLYRQKQRFNR
jgi:hypothetical protein